MRENTSEAWSILKKDILVSTYTALSTPRVLNDQTELHLSVFVVFDILYADYCNGMLEINRIAVKGIRFVNIEWVHWVIKVGRRQNASRVTKLALTIYFKNN